MSVQVWCAEIDEDNKPVGERRSLGSFPDRAAGEAFINSQLADYDHHGFVPDGDRAGWWGRNDRDHAEKFHFWVE